MKKSIFLSIVLLWVGVSFANERSNRPIQLQYVVSAKWGASIGYHITKSIYLGFLYKSDYKSEDSADNMHGQSGVKSTTYEREAKKLIELRFSPMENGLYLSTGYFINAKQTTKSIFKKRIRNINGTSYDTGMKIDVEHPEWGGTVIGFGYTAIFDYGFSLLFGVVGNPWVKVDPKATIYDTDEPFQEADRQALIKHVENETNKNNIFMISIGIGYNF